MKSARHLMLVLGSLMVAVSAQAQFIWDPATDFSITNGNPNGVWTYGWMDTGFVTFTPYANSFSDSTGRSWYGWAGDRTPAVWLNTGPSTINGVPPGTLSIHPGNGNEPSVLRWTAPAGSDGTAQVVGQFLAGDIGTMQLAIFKNDMTAPNTLWTATDAGSFNLSVNLVAGDTLNFAVFGGYAFGNTPIQLTISAVPEPSVFALTALGAIGLFLCRRSHFTDGPVRGLRFESD